MLIKLTSIVFQNQGEEILFKIPKGKQIDFNYGFEPIEEEDRIEAIKNEVEAAGGCVLAYIEKSMKALLQSKKKRETELIMSHFIFFSEEGEERYKIPGRLSFLKIEQDERRAVEFAGKTFLLSISSDIKRR